MRTEAMHVYLFGHLQEQTDFPTTAVLTRRADGWRMRSTNASYQHDYVCYESLSDVMEWIDADLRRPLCATNREEALSLLTASTTSTSSGHRLGFLYPSGVEPGSVEEAERVLRHLECGW